MLWALTSPLPDDRTDFGEMSPVMVLTSDIFVSAETTSLMAGVAITHSEVIKRTTKKYGAFANCNGNHLFLISFIFTAPTRRLFASGLDTSKSCSGLEETGKNARGY